MKEYKRLFDIIYYQRDNKFQETAIAAKEIVNGKPSWKSYSSDDCIRYVNQVSNALIKLGIQKADKIAMVSNNRPEWNFMDLGMQQLGAVNVSVYPTISEPEYVYIFNDAEVKICFVSGKELYDKIMRIKKSIPSLENVYTFDEVEGATHWRTLLSDPSEEEQKAIDELKAGIDPESLATMIYTSGTTGNPKGVMLSHRNLVSNTHSTSTVLPIEILHKGLSFLPLCHSFERIVQYIYLASGISIYYAESLDTIGDDLKDVRPNCFTTVPRLLEKVYEKIMQIGYGLTGIKRKLFFWAVGLGEKYELNTRMGLGYDLQLWLARKLIFSKWQAALGGNIKVIVTGAAAFQPRLAKIFTAAGLKILEGYGMTESSPVIAINRMPEKDRMIGTVGLAVPGVEVKIAKDGEILAKGPNVMMGYHKLPELTAETVENGWLHTGDVGEFRKGRFLKITDRKKELFKTSGGKYVAPQPLENTYKEISMIEQIMIVGENRKFVSALIVPSFPALDDWCEKKGLTHGSKEEMVAHPEVIKELGNAIISKNGSISKVEQVKKFVLLPDEWSPQSGELTPTLKLKRRVLLDRYEDRIEEIYNV